MDILDYFYNIDYSNIDFFPRKYKIDMKISKLFIYGAPLSGKSYIALDYLNSLKKEKSLYIDLQDPKLKFNSISLDKLENFILENEIETLVLDHYTKEESILDIEVKSLVVISQISSLENLKDFESLRVFPLDFEEFFSFQRRGLEKYIFSLFLKRGTLPRLAKDIDTPREELFKRFIRSSFSELEENLLMVLSHFNGTNVTPHQIYTYSKRNFRVSKDTIYKKIKEFIQRDIIFFIEDSRNRSIKKLIVFDFALVGYLSLSQKFIKQFDSMIALSLIKDNIEFKSFKDSSYITLKNTLIIPAPFESEESAFSRAKIRLNIYRVHNIKMVYIVTVSTQYRFTIENIVFEAIPFYEWVLIDDEV